MIKYLKCVICMFFLFTHPLYAETHTATSCSDSDVQTAINAAHDGDTVTMPPGTCSWKAVVTVDLSSGLNRALTIQGAGIDQTIIKDNIDAGKVSPLVVITAAGKSFRLTGITFDGTNQYPNDTCVYSYPTSLCHSSMVVIKGSSKSIRIDHNKFINIEKRGLYIEGYMNGVVDANYFIKGANNNSVQTVTQVGNATGEGAWAEPTGLGGSNFIFYENNTFDYSLGSFPDSAFDAGGSARMVFRYNNFIGTSLGWHGTGSGVPRRGTRAWEIYNNYWYKAPSRGSSYAIIGHSGSGVIYNNKIWPLYNNEIYAGNMRLPVANYDFWGQCDGLRRKVCADSGIYVHACTADADCSAHSYGTCSKHLCKSPLRGTTWTKCSTNSDCTGALGAGYTCDGYFDGCEANGANSSGTAACGTCSATQMSISGTPWTTNQWAGYYLYNESDKTGVDASWCRITSNTTSTITCTAAMVGGTSNTWVSGNFYSITNGWPCRDQIGRGIDNNLEPVYVWGNTEVDADGNFVKTANLRADATTIITSERDFYTAATYDALTQKPSGYTPYTYPHPLTVSYPLSVPDAPQNLRDSTVK
jgi:hypothetical protein